MTRWMGFSQDDFTHSVRVWLKDLSGVLQMAAHFYPPDGGGAIMPGPPSYYVSSTDAEEMWQVEFAVLPQLKTQWESRSTGGESLGFGVPYEEILAAVLALTLIAPADSLAHVTLRCLQRPNWGQIVQSASTIGLLCLGDQKVNLDCLTEVFGPAALPREWRQHTSSELRDRRDVTQLDPKRIPLQVWKSALQTLRAFLPAEHPCLRTLLQIGWDLQSGSPEDELAGEILLLAVDIGFYDEYLHGAILDHLQHSDPAARVRMADSWRGVLRKGGLQDTDPHLAAMVEEALSTYAM